MFFKKKQPEIKKKLPRVVMHDNGSYGVLVKDGEKSSFLDRNSISWSEVGAVNLYCQMKREEAEELCKKTISDTSNYTEVEEVNKRAIKEFAAKDFYPNGVDRSSGIVAEYKKEVIKKDSKPLNTEEVWEISNAMAAQILDSSVQYVYQCKSDGRLKRLSQKGVCAQSVIDLAQKKKRK